MICTRSLRRNGVLCAAIGFISVFLCAAPRYSLPQAFPSWLRPSSCEERVESVHALSARIRSRYDIDPDVVSALLSNFSSTVQRLFPLEDYGYFSVLRRSRIVACGILDHHDHKRIGMYMYYPRTRSRDGSRLYEGAFACYEAAFTICAWLEDLGIPAQMRRGATSVWGEDYYAEIPGTNVSFSATPLITPLGAEEITPKGPASLPVKHEMRLKGTYTRIDSALFPMEIRARGDDTYIIVSAGMLREDGHSHAGFNGAVKFRAQSIFIDRHDERGTRQITIATSNPSQLRAYASIAKDIPPKKMKKAFALWREQRAFVAENVTRRGTTPLLPKEVDALKRMDKVLLEALYWMLRNLDDEWLASIEQGRERLYATEWGSSMKGYQGNLTITCPDSLRYHGREAPHEHAVVVPAHGDA